MRIHPTFLLPTLLLTCLAPTTVQPIPPQQSKTPPATQPTTQPRRFISIADVLEKTPDNLRPRPGKDWAKNTQPQFAAWLSQQLVGMTVDQQMSYTGAKISPNPHKHSPTDASIVSLYYVPQRALAFGYDNSWQFKFPDLLTDLPTAKMWEKFTFGDPVHIIATIKSITLAPGASYSDKTALFDLTITLDHAQFTPIPISPALH